jgi:hypothetical protein
MELKTSITGTTFQNIFFSKQTEKFLKAPKLVDKDGTTI